MLPALHGESASLADVLTSALSSVRGASSPLALPATRSAAVVLVDGFGISALRARSGHARNITAALPTRGGAINAGFPTTTASALATLTTGVSSGQHGMVGYTALDPVGDRVVQQLGRWPADLDPRTWQRRTTVFERASETGVDAVVVAAQRYADTAFTDAVLRGARFVVASSIADRVQATLDLLAGPTPSLIYTYVPELDKIGHASGVESGAWTAALEELDSALGLLSRVPSRSGILLTADHGMLDVPAHARLVIPAASDLWRGVRHVAGEPRCLQLHLETADDLAEVLERWRAAESSRAWVVSRAEALAAGWFGDVEPSILPRIGDVLIAARSRVAYYDERTSDARSLAMVGQHGSLSGEEMRVPLARWGAFAT